MAAKTLAHDYDFAFDLQMQEALLASRVLHTSAPKSTTGDFESEAFYFTDGDDFNYTDLLFKDLDRLEQEKRDREFGEIKRLKLGLDRWIHDQKFAKEIMEISDAEWRNRGAYYGEPYEFGASSSSAAAVDVYAASSSGIKVTGKVEPQNSSVSALINQVALLQKKLSDCQLPFCLTIKYVKFVFKLARDGITSQIKWLEETVKNKTLKETCVICFEGVNTEKMFSVDGCFHRFCFTCMKQYVEVKLLEGKPASCPINGCKSQVKIETCAKFLDPKVVEVIKQRVKENSISVSEKVYCPYPKCSELMTKNQVLDYTKLCEVDGEESGARKCMKCKFIFCINCKVPWHSNMTCTQFCNSNQYKSAGDGKLKSLAQSKMWRQCKKCNNMVELVSGCYHITCRCGYEFCYTCGAQWKKKKATCSCLIWDERTITRY